MARIFPGVLAVLVAALFEGADGSWLLDRPGTRRSGWKAADGDHRKEAVGWGKAGWRTKVAGPPGTIAAGAIAQRPAKPSPLKVNRTSNPACRYFLGKGQGEEEPVSST